jgi:hypothetical protein
MAGLPRFLLVLLAIGVATGVVWSAKPLPVRGQPQQRVISREASPSCQESIAELGLEGEEVHCVEPLPPTSEEPQMHGPYRLVPPGYVGALSYEYTGPAEIPPGAITSEIAVLQASSLYRPPAYLPDGYSLSSMDTFDGDSETVIRAVYRGAPGPSRSSASVATSGPSTCICPIPRP